jgi:hypothetical protein
LKCVQDSNKHIIKEIVLQVGHLPELLNFLDSISKNTQISYFIKIHPVADELFHADRRMDGQT